MTATLQLIDLELIARNVDKLPTPSEVIAELLRHIDDDDMSSGALANLIVRDQALVIRMLRIANSSFYGMSGRVESISDAIAILGLRVVRTLATASAFSGLFSAISTPNFDIKLFWRHSIATALSAREVARHMKQPEGAAFVAGLLHDIGRLMLARSFPAHLAAVTEQLSASNNLMHVAEQATLGIDHAKIGGFLAERWHFPKAICTAIGEHHQVDHLDSTPLACAVHLGDILSHALDLTGNPTEMVPPISEDSWNRANLSWKNSHQLFAKIEQEFELLSKTLLN